MYECFHFIFACALQACLVPEARKQVSDSSIWLINRHFGTPIFLWGGEKKTTQIPTVCLKSGSLSCWLSHINYNRMHMIQTVKLCPSPAPWTLPTLYVILTQLPALPARLCASKSSKGAEAGVRGVWQGRKGTYNKDLSPTVLEDSKAPEFLG